MNIYHQFKDRSEELFGRKKDIEHLLQRVRRKGITAVSGRPQLGKTWLLEQVGWVLESHEQYIVGYNESTGESDDHLLRTVLDLYKRWLSSASMIAQAESIFKRHRGKLISGAGKLFGIIFKDAVKLSGIPIDSTFKILEQYDQDLKTGGIKLSELDYEATLNLTKLVYDETVGKPIVLILDGFEKSPNIQKIFNMLEAFLKHINSWVPCHILLGIRNPELRTTESQEAYRLVEDLEKASILASIMHLNPMDLEDVSESRRMIEYVYSIAPFTETVDENTLKRMIDGFPGVIKRIREKPDKKKLTQETELKKLVTDAQNYRYREFDKLLPNLKEDQLTIAIRVAVFNRLSKETWPLFREILCEGISQYAWEDLFQEKIFESSNFPSYGHDARHECAFSYFKRTRNSRVCNELETIINSLACEIKHIDGKYRHFASSLAGLHEKATSIKINNFSQALCFAARSLFEDISPEKLGILDTAISIYSKKHIGVSCLLFTAFLNRGVRKGQMGDNQGEIEDYSAVVDMPDAPADKIAQALNNRGVSKGQMGDNQGAIEDYSAVVDMPDAPADQIAQALNNRGVSKGQMGDNQGAIEDYSAVVDMPDAPADQIAQALYNRGVRKGQMGDNQGEIEDYSAVVDMPDAPADKIAQALYNRGVSKGQMGDNQGAIEDYSAVVDMPDAPADKIAQALYNRGVSKGQMGDNQGAIEDYSAVVDMPDAPADKIAQALYNRGVSKGQMGDNQGAIEDYSAVVDMPDAPADQIAQALYNRGVRKGQMGDNQGEIEDYSAVVDMPDAPADKIAQALYNRGVSKGQMGDNQGEIEDYSAVVDMPDAPADMIAFAGANLAFYFIETGDISNGIDFAYKSIFSKQLPDGGLKMLNWFRGKESRLYEIVKDSEQSSIVTGTALAFLSLLIGKENKDLMLNWDKTNDSQTALDICNDLLSFWGFHKENN